jgi:hypothetical protein
MMSPQKSSLSSLTAASLRASLSAISLSRKRSGRDHVASGWAGVSRLNPERPSGREVVHEGVGTFAAAQRCGGAAIPDHLRRLSRLDPGTATAVPEEQQASFVWQQGPQRLVQQGVRQIDLAHEIQGRRHGELAGEALPAFGEPLRDRSPLRVGLAHRPGKPWRKIGQPAEARAARAAFAGLETDRRLAQPLELRGKKTELGAVKKWLDIGSVLEHDFTHE